MSKILKNTTYLTTAFIMQKILSFIFFSIVARVLNVEETGIYTFSLGFTTMFAIFVDLGLSPVLVRECAKNKDNSETLLNKVLGIKLLMALITYIIVLFTINIFEQSVLVQLMVYFSGVLMVIDSFILSFWAVFRGRQNLKYEAISVVIAQSIVLLVGGVVLYFRLPIVYLIVSFIIASTFTFLYALFLLKKKLNIKVKPNLKNAFDKKLLLMALPFALLGLFTRFYSSLDTVLLKFIGGKEFGGTWVGIYSVPYKITFALQFIPSAFAASMYPAMSEYFVKSKEKLVAIFEKAMVILIIFSIPASFGIAALADIIILNVYGDKFYSSIMPLQILVISMIFSFIQFPVGSLLNAAHKQSINTKNMGIALVISTILNLIFIPQYSYLATSTIALITQGLLFFLGIRHCKNIIDYDKKKLLVTFLKSISAALVMLLIILYGKIFFINSDTFYQLLSLGLLPLIGAVTYFFFLFFSKGIDMEYFIPLFDLVKSKIKFNKK